MFPGYLIGGLSLTRQVMCEEFSQCYDDVNICLWTNGSHLNWRDAQSACQNRNSSLPRITNSDIQSKLAEFRSAAGNLLSNDGFWIDVKAVISNDWQWVNEHSFAGLFFLRQYKCIMCVIMHFDII